MFEKQVINIITTVPSCSITRMCLKHRKVDWPNTTKRCNTRSMQQKMPYKIIKTLTNIFQKTPIQTKIPSNIIFLNYGRNNKQNMC